MKVNVIYLSIYFCLIFSFGCQDRDKKGNVLDTPTTGSISIAVDETLVPILDAEIDTFEGIYKYANITPYYVPEVSAIEQLLKDSVRLAIVSRKLTAKEEEVLKNQKIPPHIVKIAIDAIALIVHKDNNDTTVSYSEVSKLFRGEVKSWKDLNKSSSLSDIQIVFDNKNSSTVRFIMDSVANVKTLPSNCFALDSNQNVVDFVSKNKNAIGVIGVSWISDRDDTLSLSFLKKVKVVGISSAKVDSLNAEEKFYKPYQAYMAQRLYPLTREIFIISREARAGLGNGFIDFVAGDVGQTVILKSGLVPATMPIRIVELKNDVLNKE